MKLNEQNLYQQTFGNHYFLVAVTACLIFVLMGVMLERLGREVSRAEQLQYEYRLMELKSAVRLMEAALRSQGELNLAYKFDGANPMDWLEDNTSHYVGLMSPEEAINYPGNWFFDPAKNEIGYVPVAEFKDKILRFKVHALRSKEDQRRFIGLALMSINPTK